MGGFLVEFHFMVQNKSIKFSLHNAGFCEDDEFKKLYERAIQIAEAKNPSLDPEQCLQGSMDTESLYQAAIELGYLQPNAPLKNFNRFAESFAEYANAIGDSVDISDDAQTLIEFQNELKLAKAINTARVFVNYDPSKLNDINAEQWDALDKIFRSSSEEASGKLSYNLDRRRNDFFKSIPLSKLADPETLNTIITRAQNQNIDLEKIFTKLMNDKNLPQDEVEKLVAAYLTQHSELVSANFLIDIMRKLNQPTPALQEAVLGKPGEEPPALLREVLAQSRELAVLQDATARDYKENKIETADRNYMALVLYACELGHADALKAFENILQDKNDFVYRKKSYNRAATLNYEDTSLRKLLQVIAANEMPSGVRKDLQENFQDFSQHIRELFPELYRQANTPAVFLLSHLIEREKQGYTTIPQLDQNHPDPKTSMNAFEAAYQAKLLAEDKEYFPPSFDNFGELLSNDSYDKTDRKALYSAMEILMKGDETDKILTQFKNATNSGHQAAPEILEYFIDHLTKPNGDVPKAKDDTISKGMAKFLDSGLNANSYLLWTEPLQGKLPEEDAKKLTQTLSENMEKISLNLNDIHFKATKPQGYHGLYQVYAKMTEQYWPIVSKKNSAASSPADTLYALDRKELYTTDNLSPLTLLKKGSMSTDPAFTNFFYRFSENMKWFHSEKNSGYPDQAQLPARQEEYRNAMKDIAEDDNHHTIDAIKALLEEELKEQTHLPQTNTFRKICRELKLQALKEVTVKTHSEEEVFDAGSALQDLALLGHPQAIKVLFELWSYDELRMRIQAKLMSLLRDSAPKNPYLATAKAQILTGAESALKHLGRHDAALELINYAAQQNVEGSFEILERIALQDSADSDAALKKLFRPHEGEPPQELEQVRQRFLDDWRNRLESDNVDEQELQKLRDLAGDDNTIIMNELSGSLNDYDQRQIEKARVEAEREAAEKAAKNAQAGASAVVSRVVAAAEPEEEPEKNLSELYDIIVDENRSEQERLQTLIELAERGTNEPEALKILAATLWDVDDEVLVDAALNELIGHAQNNGAAIDLLSSIIDGCEQGIQENPERCRYILEYLAATEQPIIGDLAQTALDTLPPDE